MTRKKVFTIESYVDSIHSGELEVKDTTESESSVLYLDILLKKTLMVT